LKVITFGRTAVRMRVATMLLLLLLLLLLTWGTAKVYAIWHVCLLYTGDCYSCFSSELLHVSS
jgi:hypothetical protein